MNQITRLRKDRGAAEPVLAESLKDQAYEAIKHRIITCAFKPGQELSENAVAGLLKIGRTPVHQTFDRLNMEGLVDVQSRKGVVVRRINLDEVIEIIEIRLLNEASRFASRQRGPAPPSSWRYATFWRMTKFKRRLASCNERLPRRRPVR